MGINLFIKYLAFMVVTLRKTAFLAFLQCGLLHNGRFLFNAYAQWFVDDLPNQGQLTDIYLHCLLKPGQEEHL
jgi:hypothetical protein